MAGVVVGRAHGKRTRRRRESDSGEIFARVADPLAEAVRPVGPGRIVLQQPAVLLQVRTAPRRIHDERVDGESLEVGDVPLGQRAGVAALAGVGVERAAAGLRGRDEDLDPIARQDPRGRGVRRREGRAHDAAGEKRDAPAHRAYGGDPPRERGRGRRGVGDQAEELSEPAKADVSHDPAASETLGEVPEPREGREPPGVGDELVEDGPPQQSLGDAALTRRLDLGASALHELAEFDARGAGRLAGSAVQTFVHVLVESVAGDVDPPVPDVLHQADAAARRVHFDAKLGERRTGGQTEAAVHAPADELLGRGIGIRESGERQRSLLHQAVIDRGPAGRARGCRSDRTPSSGAASGMHRSVPDRRRW